MMQNTAKEKLLAERRAQELNSKRISTPLSHSKSAKGTPHRADKEELINESTHSFSAPKASTSIPIVVDSYSEFVSDDPKILPCQGCRQPNCPYCFDQKPNQQQATAEKTSASSGSTDSSAPITFAAMSDLLDKKLTPIQQSISFMQHEIKDIKSNCVTKEELDPLKVDIAELRNQMNSIQISESNSEISPAQFRFMNSIDPAHKRIQFQGFLLLMNAE